MPQFHAKLLGYLGLLPFIFLPFFALWGNVSYFEAREFFIVYSAIILSFLGGVLWFDAISNNKSIRQFYIAMLPSIVGWVSATILPSLVALICLPSLFLLVIVYEFNTMQMTRWYRSLRIRLTSIVIGSHGMMLWLTYPMS